MRDLLNGIVSALASAVVLILATTIVVLALKALAWAWRVTF